MEDFTLATMPERFAKLGDVQAGIDDAVVTCASSSSGWSGTRRRDRRGAYPPQFPKMPGEPKRVQPSRAKKDSPG